MAQPLSRAQIALLTGLYALGGSADIDMHGRLIAGPIRETLPGDPVAWLVLVAQGLLAGEDGRLILTQEGRDVAAHWVNGRVVVAS